MDSYSAMKRNKGGSVKPGWMGLEPIIQSEVSQKNKYRILTHVYEIQKNDADESIYRAGIEIQTQRADLWTQWGKEREGQVEKAELTCIHCYV